MNDSDYNRLLTTLIILQNTESLSWLLLYGLILIVSSILMEWLRPFFEAIYTPVIFLLLAGILYISFIGARTAFRNSSSCRLISGLFAGAGIYIGTSLSSLMFICCLYEIAFNMEENIVARSLQGFAALLIFTLTGLMIVGVLAYMADWLFDNKWILLKSAAILVFSHVCMALFYYLVYYTRYISKLYQPNIHNFSLFS